MGGLILMTLIGFWQQRRAQRRQFTMTIMLELLTNKSFVDAYTMIMRHVENKTVIVPEAMSQHDDQLVAGLLSMHEFIAINALAGTIDRKIILRQRRSGLIKVHEVCADFIQHKRTVWQRPSVYKSFEALISEHAVTPPRRQAKQAGEHHAEIAGRFR